MTARSMFLGFGALATLASACTTFGTAERPDAGAPDSSTDAGVSVDAPSPSEAGADASRDAAAFGCGSSTAWICDTFDDARGLDGRWANDVAGGGSVLLRDDPSAPTPPKAFEGVGPSSARGRIRASRATSKNARCVFDMKIAKVSMAESVLMEVSIKAVAGQWAVALSGFPNNSLGVSTTVTPRTGNPQTAKGPIINDLRVGEWHRVQVDFGNGTSTPVLVFTVDGKLALSIPTNVDFSSIGQGQDTTLFIGPSTYAGGGEWTALYDNVRCDDL